MELEILGMNFACVLASLSEAKIPDKGCLLPLASKLLGYGIVAASTTVKLPQGFKTLEMRSRKRPARGTKPDSMGMNIGILGYIIIASSTVGKLPQILKILKHGSVRGLSVASFELEVVGYTIALAYCIHKGLPFSAYGELAFLLIQAIILVAIIYYYSPPMGTKTRMKALLYFGLAPTVLAGKIDPGLFEVLYASQHAVFFFARLPQIWTNFRNKGTGELSFLTCFMNFAGSIDKSFHQHPGEDSL
ncbi:hypothetical protein ACP4OV_019216 [Aristida adscensionis]